MGLFANIRAGIREVNRRYERPELKTTLFTRICLVCLRAYLLLMVALMLFALVHTAMSGGEAVKQAAQPAALSPSP